MEKIAPTDQPTENEQGVCYWVFISSNRWDLIFYDDIIYNSVSMYLANMNIWSKLQLIQSTYHNSTNFSCSTIQFQQRNCQFIVINFIFSHSRGIFVKLKCILVTYSFLYSAINKLTEKYLQLLNPLYNRNQTMEYVRRETC